MVIFMAFDGWVLKINDKKFPMDIIAFESYKVTPNQTMDLDPYRDADGLLHRNILSHKASSVEFSTHVLRERQLDSIRWAITDDMRAKCNVQYWNPIKGIYESGEFYMADIALDIINVDEARKDILYKPIQIILTEY